MPPEIAELTKGVASINTGIDYKLFHESSAAEFVRKAYGSEILKLYRTCRIPAMRADLFRYCFLVRHGGIYIDADYVGVSPVKPILNKPWNACLYKRERGLANGMMYFDEPNHPLALKILEVALRNASTRSSNNVWQVTGPSVLQTLHADNNNAEMFQGVHLMEEQEFAEYFIAAPDLEYKNEDSHWLVARQKGLDIFHG